ncbi:MAG: hypothetical protein RXR01_10535 [Thermoproteus sp.]
MFTVVVYARKRIKRVVLYANYKPFVFTITADKVIGGTVKKRWKAGNTEAYSMRVRGIDIAPFLHAKEDACRRYWDLDPVFREAVREGYRVHHNEYYVQLWLSKPLGEPVGRVGEIDERALGDCIKHFTHSYAQWRIVTPPWCAVC